MRLSWLLKVFVALQIWGVHKYEYEGWFTNYRVLSEWRLFIFVVFYRLHECKEGHMTTLETHL